ncbi:MAG: CBS domain-containing protein, partial [Rhodospirillaceae bacterium]|nr:CBS domain-containing protein [Rhodospirillaceae bacterium]
MRAVTGATPLFALHCVALDLETTSLDASLARIVQIGALRLDGKELDGATPLNQIVNPRDPIPPASTAVHGITDAMAAASPDLAALWSSLLAFIEGRILVGHTLAYDLTILEREAARYRLDWPRPRSLCIRRLAPIAIPNLHDPSLDKLAAWLGIEIGQRHSALADAEAAGQIFLRMVPLLAERGIKTLAEAERAALSRAPQIQQERESGWIQPIADPTADAILGGTRTYDTYAYRHTVGDVMARDVAVVPRSMLLHEATQVMARRGISSVMVAETPISGQALADYAILTERDVLRRIAKDGAAALTVPTAAVSSAPVRSIREKAFVYRAIARMQRLKVRHLAVVDDEGQLTGMISARDLLKLRTEPAIALTDAIKEAQSPHDMAVAWSGLAKVVQSLTQEGLEAHVITRIVSEELRVMTERAAGLAEAAMIAEGRGGPPCAFAVMVLGSGGRGESLLKPDQDNAIVFAHGDPDGQEDRWFAAFGEHMSAILDAAGIPLCQGGVMARNAAWRGSVATWRDRVAVWVASANPRNLLNVDIFFDLIPVVGEKRLATDLLAYAYETGSQNPIFAKLLGVKLEQISNPFGFLGRLNTDDGWLDLKLYALFPIVTAARTLAIRN